MKRILLPALLLSFFLFSCDTLNKIASTLPPTDFEKAAGLRDALTQGLYAGFDDFSSQEQGNPLVRFAFPGDAAKIEKTLNDIGMRSLVNQVTQKFTTAMSQAVVAAKPIFLDAVKNMSLRDVTSLLITDNLHAATDYFKNTMRPQLMTAFRPIVDSTANLNGANREWTNLVNVYNKIPLISKPLENSLTDFISSRAIEAMFTSVAREEENIRTKLEFRKTDMMKKVFAYADQELQRRKTQQPGM